jgi:hypothetical protein
MAKSAKTIPVLVPDRSNLRLPAQAPLQPLPPLRLYHLFALTAVVAVLLTFYELRPMAAAFGEGSFPRWLSFVLIGTGVLYTLLHALAITFVSFAVAWHRKSIWTFSQPGHWLLISIAMATAIGLLFALIRALVQWFFGVGSSTEGTTRSVLFFMFTAPENLATVAINIYIGRKQLPDRQWARIFYWKAVATLLPFIGDLGVLHLMQLTARSERRAHVPRDAAHRCGFWIQYVASGVTVLLMFAFLAAFITMMPFW